MQVYAKKIISALAIVFLLTGCVTSGGGMGLPWGGSPSADGAPNVGWQTKDQRQELADQKKEQDATEKPASPEAAPAPVAEPAKRKVSVNLLLPLSGKKSDLGQSMLKAAQMALFDIGGADFELTPRDTKSTKEGAVDAARTAAGAGADLILGPVFAEDLKAIKASGAAGSTPVISFTTDWTLTGDNTYIMGFLPFVQVSRAAQYAASQGFGKFAVYAPKTEYCDVVIAALQKTSVNVVRVGRYASMQSDLGSLIGDFAEQGKKAGASDTLDFNALMLPLGGEGLRTLASTLGTHGVKQPKVKFVGTGLWDDAGLTNFPALYGGWYAAPDPAPRADFEKRFRENYGAPPARLATLAYDATALAAVLARSNEGDASPFTHAAITNPRGFAGIDGIFRFRNDGLSERGLAILELQAGKPRVIDPAPTSFSSSGS